MGQLTTHVLDTSAGRPGSGIAWTLYRLEDDHSLLCKGITNDDGRNDGPILSGEAFMAGTYELHFEVGDYFRRMAQPSVHPLFWIRWSCALAFRIQTNTIMCLCWSRPMATARIGAADQSFARPWLTQDLNFAACLATRRFTDPLLMCTRHCWTLSGWKPDSLAPKRVALRETAARAQCWSANFTMGYCNTSL